MSIENITEYGRYMQAYNLMKLFVKLSAIFSKLQAITHLLILYVRKDSNFQPLEPKSDILSS